MGFNPLNRNKSTEKPTGILKKRKYILRRTPKNRASARPDRALRFVFDGGWFVSIYYHTVNKTYSTFFRNGASLRAGGKFIDA